MSIFIKKYYVLKVLQNYIDNDLYLSERELFEPLFNAKYFESIDSLEQAIIKMDNKESMNIIFIPILIYKTCEQ